jgi:hypothetical protein
MKYWIANVFIFIQLICFHQNTTAQLNAKDSIFYHKAIQYTANAYYQNIGDQATKYNGSQYPGYTVSFSDGHPYFRANVLSKGSITYDGIQFDNVSILFDEVMGCVVLQDSSHRIQLVNERLSNFNIHDCNFERLIKKDNDALLSTGFYQVLVKGNTSLYKREIKKMVDKYSNSNELAILFEVKEYYYILKNGKYHEINTKQDLLKQLGDRDTEINEFTKEQQLNFRKEKQGFMTKVIAYYNQLTH